MITQAPILSWFCTRTGSGTKVRLDRWTYIVCESNDHLFSQGQMGQKAYVMIHNYT